MYAAEENSKVCKVLLDAGADVETAVEVSLNVFLISVCMYAPSVSV